MNNLRNRVQLIGNLGNTPKLQETSTGNKYVKMNAAKDVIEALKIATVRTW